MNSGGGLSKVVAIIGGGVSGAGAAYHLAQALAPGQVDIIVRAPASDEPTLKRDSKLAVTTVDTVYVFNMELDMRDKSPQVSAKDGSPLPKNPLQDVKVREAIDLAIDRPALAEIAMEGLGSPVNQLVTPDIAGYNKSLPAL